MSKDEKDPLGKRLKSLEASYQLVIPREKIIVVRLDGRSFHRVTKELPRPFDANFCGLMDATMLYLCENIAGVRYAYTQSDEITLLLSALPSEETQHWFGGKVQKIVSVSASLATEYFIKHSKDFCIDLKGVTNFDSRCYGATLEEAADSIAWRFKDAVRNSISMAAQSVFSHKELQGKKATEMLEMLYFSNNPWDKQPHRFRFGANAFKIAVTLINPEGVEYQRGVWKLSSDTILSSSEIIKALK